MRGKYTNLTVVSCAVLGLLAASCSSDESSSGSTAAAVTTSAVAQTTVAAETTAAVETTAAALTTTTAAATTTTAPATTTTEAPEVLRIMVTGDDGYAAAGINAIVAALNTLDDVQVDVISPLANQSGTGPSLTDGPLTVTDVTMPNGTPARAVDGFPADTVVYAFDQGGLPELPHLVVSGINIGQNAGPVLPVSGTVGAAQAAANRGVPAIAASQQTLADEAAALPFDVTIEPVLAWIEQNRENLLAGTMPDLIYNFNGPSCTSGEPRDEVLTVSVAADLEGVDYFGVADCVTPLASPPTDDVRGFLAGYVTYTELDPMTLAPAA